MICVKIVLAFSVAGIQHGMNQLKGLEIVWAEMPYTLRKKVIWCHVLILGLCKDETGQLKTRGKIFLKKG